MSRAAAATTLRHVHEAATLTERPFTDPVALPAYQNRAAHGNVERTEWCSCGATRKVLLNGRHRETSPWS